LDLSKYQERKRDRHTSKSGAGGVFYSNSRLKRRQRKRRNGEYEDDKEISKKTTHPGAILWWGQNEIAICLNFDSGVELPYKVVIRQFVWPRQNSNKLRFWPHHKMVPAQQCNQPKERSKREKKK